MNKKTLEWGETPWDNMSRGELFKELLRMYSALRSLYSVAEILRIFDENNPYYGKSGVGGNAIEKGRQVLEPLFAQYEGGEESIFRAFSRYADDLLFDQSSGFTMLGDGWAVCPSCGLMIGKSMISGPAYGKTCGEVSPNGSCKGILRPLSWEDLEPKRGRGGSDDRIRDAARALLSETSKFEKGAFPVNVLEALDRLASVVFGDLEGERKTESQNKNKES